MNVIESANDLHGAIRRTCDVVVVGSGAGGAAAAYELTASGFDVLLIEAGPHVRSEEFTQREWETMRRIYVDQGVQGPIDRSISIFQGRAIGGSTIINGEVAFRIPDDILGEWKRLHGVDGFEPDVLRPIFEDVERMSHVTVNEGRYLASSVRFAAGVRNLGLAVKPLSRTVENCRGCSYCFIGCAYGCKRSTDKTYIPAALEKGASVLCDATVERISFDGRRATGVVARSATATITVEARAVVLACGAIATPLLLLDHRRGGAAAGRNLALHPVLTGMAWYDDEIRAYDGKNVLATYTDAFASDGVLIEMGAATPTFLAPVIPGFGAEHRRLVNDIGRAGSAVAVIRDSGLGRVRRDRQGRKVIDYRLDAEATRRVRVGMRALGSIALASGARKVAFTTTIPRMFTSEADLDAVAELPLGPADVQFISYHPQGTARLGEVTDLAGEVRDAPGLYVMDASLFPSPIGVNTQVPVMALAVLLARRLATRLGGRAAA